MWQTQTSPVRSKSEDPETGFVGQRLEEAFEFGQWLGSYIIRLDKYTSVAYSLYIRLARIQWRSTMAATTIQHGRS